MKKVLLLVLSFVLIACFASGLVACNTGVEDTTDNGSGTDVDAVTENILYRLEEDGSGAVVVGIGGGFNGETVVIPEKATIDEKEYPVVGIGEKALQNFDTVKSVKLPATLKRIEDSAFFDCDLLESIEIPEGVTEISKDAFMKCKSLKSVSLPESLTSIGAKCFSECVSLEIIYLPRYIKTLEEGVFNDCTSLVFCGLNKVESIGKYAFSGCTALQNITFPESVASVQEGAFAYCTEIAIDIKNTDVVFAEQVFTDGVNLELSLPEFKAIQGISSDMIKKVTAVYDNDVLTIGNYEDGLIIEKADCTGTLDLNIDLSYLNSKGLKKISDNAFKDNSKLTDTTISDSIESIGKAAFFGCNSLATVTIGKGVTSIGEDAFRGCRELTEINYNAVKIDCLNGNSNIFCDAGINAEGINVVFGKSVEQIPSYLFYVDTLSRPKVVKVTINNSVKSIGSSAFRGCSLLTSITIPDSVTSIGNATFATCRSLTSITIPDSVKSIGQFAFENCDSLTSITIPDSVTSIGDYAFQYCDSLTIYCQAVSKQSGWGERWNSDQPIVWDCNNKDVADDGYIYYVADNGIRYALKDGEAIVAKQAENLSGDKEIPSKISYKGVDYIVTSIGNSAFLYCRSLTSIIIPDSVKSIGMAAFSGCSSLESITLPFVGAKAETTTSDTYQYSFGYIFGTAEYDGGEATEQNYYGSSTGSMQIITYYIPVKLKNVKVTGGKYILAGAFSNCRSLTSITIPDSITSIGYEAFYSCISLTIYCEAVSKPEGWRNYWNDNSPIVWDCNNNDIADDGYIYYVADNGIRYALKDGEAIVTRQARNLSGNKEIPSKISYKGVDYIVTSIGDYAFSDCSLLTSITIPGGVTSIGDHALSDCSSLTRITIPDSVASIGYFAFDSCSSLINITIPDSVTNIGHFAFSGCRSLTSITIPNSVKYIGDFVFADCRSLTSITIPDSVTSIGDYAFQYCDSLTSITIPDSVKSIGQFAFENCDSLTSITIPDSVTSISDYAFQYCDSLTIYCQAVSKPSGWGERWNSDQPIVWDCNNKDVADDGYIYYVADNGIRYALKDGKAIVIKKATNLSGDKEIPSKISYKGVDYIVTSIGDSAFEGCSSLESITIPESVTSIGHEAFSGCSSLTSVTFKNTQGCWRLILLSDEINIITFIYSQDLANTEKVARYLKDKYCYYYWERI